MNSILLIDDDPSFLELVKELIENLDVAVKVHSSADGLRAYLLARTQEFDLILADYNLPSLSKEKLVQGLRENSKRKDVPIVVVTGDPDGATQALSSDKDVRVIDKLDAVHRVPELVMQAVQRSHELGLSSGGAETPKVARSVIGSGSALGASDCSEPVKARVPHRELSAGERQKILASLHNAVEQVLADQHGEVELTWSTAADVSFLLRSSVERELQVFTFAAQTPAGVLTQLGLAATPRVMQFLLPSCTVSAALGQWGESALQRVVDGELLSGVGPRLMFPQNGFRLPAHVSGQAQKLTLEKSDPNMFAWIFVL